MIFKTRKFFWICLVKFMKVFLPVKSAFRGSWINVTFSKSTFKIGNYLKNSYIRSKSKNAYQTSIASPKTIHPSIVLHVEDEKQAQK